MQLAERNVFGRRADECDCCPNGTCLEDGVFAFGDESMQFPCTFSAVEENVRLVLRGPDRSAAVQLIDCGGACESKDDVLAENLSP